MSNTDDELDKILTTDEYANAINGRNKKIEELEKQEFKTGEDYILLKWGTLKGWELNSILGKKLSDEYISLGRSMGTMSQKDTDRQKQIILEMIDECDGSIQNDWSGEHFTKEQAKEYVRGYNE